MNQFQGISSKAIALLAENRYHDSKIFYEAHKEELKQLATLPMRQVMMDLSDTLLKLDEEMYLDPVYSVSRIRRDTRYTKDKTLYREHMWIMFRRNKAIYRNCPFLWFEISPAGYDYGIAFFTEKPSYMDEFRQAVTTRPEVFRQALATVQKAKLQFCGDVYKRPKVLDANPELFLYMNAKNLQFMKSNGDLRRIESDIIIKDLRKMIRTVQPMYSFLLDVHNEICAKEL